MVQKCNKSTEYGNRVFIMPDYGVMITAQGFIMQTAFRKSGFL